MRKTWYNVKAAAAGTPATISIFDEIGMWGVTAKDFIASFRQITENDVVLELNTPGGSVFDALAMFNAMKISGKNITVKVMGIAASAGSYLAMVGNKIIMPENTFMMVHNPLNAIYGNAAEMREMADVLDKIGNSLTATYVARTGKSDEEVRALLANDTYMTAAECLELGFCDEVSPAVTATAKFEREHLPANIQALFKAVEPDPLEQEAFDEVDETAADPDAVIPVSEPEVVAFADQVLALATDAGYSDFAPLMVLDPKLSTVDLVKARLADMREIRALCEVAKQPDLFPKLISAGASIADTRTALCDALANSDGKTSVNTTQPSSEKPIIGTCQSAVKTADILAKYRINIRSKK
jgi:ATP-dependent Clp endopeptidase proteolytic subunit ClpP